MRTTTQQTVRTTTHTIQGRELARLEDYDDCLDQAEYEAARTFKVERWQVEAAWGDGRNSIVVTVRAWIEVLP